MLLDTHDFGGTTPRAARCRINIPTLQSYRLWSLLSAHHWYLKLRKGVKFIVNTVIQSFRCLNVAVSLEVILENFSKLFCWELSASWNHQNSVLWPE